MKWHAPKQASSALGTNVSNSEFNLLTKVEGHLSKRRQGRLALSYFTMYLQRARRMYKYTGCPKILDLRYNFWISKFRIY